MFSLPLIGLRTISGHVPAMLVGADASSRLAAMRRAAYYEGLCTAPGSKPLPSEHGKPLLPAGPLQFSYGDKQPGMMPWSGQGESWICWRYLHPRSPATVLLTLPLEVLALADLELLAFSPQAACFVPVEFDIAELAEPGLYPIAGECKAAVLLSLKVAPFRSEIRDEGEKGGGVMEG